MTLFQNAQKSDWVDDLIAKKQGSISSLATTLNIKTENGNELGNFSYALCITFACNNAWIIDTKTTDHMTNNFKKFIIFTKNYLKYVKTTKNYTTIVTRISTVELTPSITLQNILIDHTLESDLL